MKGSASNLGVRVAIGLVLALAATVASLAIRWHEYLEPSAWDPRHPKGTSDFEEVLVGGWPIDWAVDHPSVGAVGRLEIPAEVDAGRLFAVLAFWSVAVAFCWTVGAALRRRTRQPPPPSRIAAGLAVSPFAAYVVVLLLFPFVQELLVDPFVHLDGMGGAPMLGDTLVWSSALALGAMAATAVVTLALGPLLVAWLRKRGRFEAGECARVGALVPVVVVGALQLAFGPAKRIGWLLPALVFSALAVAAVWLARRLIPPPLRALAGRLWSALPAIVFAVLGLSLATSLGLATVRTMPWRMELLPLVFASLTYTMIALAGMATAWSLWVIASAGVAAKS